MTSKGSLIRSVLLPDSLEHPTVARTRDTTISTFLKCFSMTFLLSRLDDAQA
jgi:hypothetical protein